MSADRQLTFAMKLAVYVAALLIPAFAVQGAAPMKKANTPASASGVAEMHIGSRTSDPFRQFNSSLIALTGKVSPGVVQVMVTAYGPAEN
jgi:hypothetical protein